MKLVLYVPLVRLKASLKASEVCAVNTSGYRKWNNAHNSCNELLSASDTGERGFQREYFCKGVPVRSNRCSAFRSLTACATCVCSFFKMWPKVSKPMKKAHFLPQRFDRGPGKYLHQRRHTAKSDA